jgi:alpha-ketoglutarate-dependent taurine dioxygenase
MRHIRTEIVGLQLKDLTSQQQDELGLLIAERSVIFFQDQDISPQQQMELGEYFGKVEVYVRCLPMPTYLYMISITTHAYMND